MRTHSAMIILATLAFAGCSGGDVTGLTPIAPDLTRPGATTRAAAATHVSGSCETTPVAPPVVTFPILRQEDTGICQLSRLGRATLRTSRIVNLVTQTQVADVAFTA